jgi:hypothetical protein
MRCSKHCLWTSASSVLSRCKAMRAQCHFLLQVMNEIAGRHTGLPGITAWNLFTVRDENGSELLKVDNTWGSEVINVYLAGRGASEQGLPAFDPVLGAVNELYSIVEREAKGDIDKAIALVDQA